LKHDKNELLEPVL